MSKIIKAEKLCQSGLLHVGHGPYWKSNILKYCYKEAYVNYYKYLESLSENV